MSFSRVNGGGWAANAALTSAQMNQLDADHASALDKTTAGDQLAGSISVASTGGVNVSSAGAAIASSVSGGIVSSASGGVQISAANGLQLNNNPQIPGGITVSATPYWPQLLSSTYTRQILTPFDVPACTASPGAQGVLPLNWLFSTTQTFLPGGNPGSGGVGGGGLTQVVNSASNNVVPYYIPIRQLHHGATLQSATMYLMAASGHGALPHIMPSFGIFRAPTLSPSGLVSLASSGVVADTTGTLAAYKLSHSWTLTCNQYNVIDITQYIYSCVLWDEGGSNAVVSNLYPGVVLQYGGIGTMAFA